MRKAAVAANRMAPVTISAAIHKIRGGLTKLQQKLAPTHVRMMEMISGTLVTQAIGVVAILGVADHVTEAGASVDVLAQQTGAHPEALYRVLRALASIGIFREQGDKTFTMTPMGECLRSDHPNSLRDLAMVETKLFWEHWAHFEYCVRNGKSAFERVDGENLYTHLAKHPKEAEIFDRAMTSLSTIESQAILATYDFSQFGTIADIGGGQGTFLAEILKVHLNTKGLLFDLPHVLEGAGRFLRAQGVPERVRIEGGSFLDWVPTGADAYILKHIIHGSPDDEVIRILKNVRNVIPDNGKLLLMERIVPPRNVPHFSKFLDLEMLVLTTGKERTKEEFAEIVSQAGFRLVKIFATISMVNVIEAVPA